MAHVVKNLPAMQRLGFDPWVGKMHWRRERLPTPVFWPGEFHVLYRPWGRRVRRDWATFTFSRCSSCFSPFLILTCQIFYFKKQKEVFHTLPACPQPPKHFPGGTVPANVGDKRTWVRPLDWEDSQGEEMGTHSCILAWEIPWTEEPGGHKESDITEWLNNNNISYWRKANQKNFYFAKFKLKLKKVGNTTKPFR